MLRFQKAEFFHDEYSNKNDLRALMRGCKDFTFKATPDEDINQNKYNEVFKKKKKGLETNVRSRRGVWCGDSSHGDGSYCLMA